jgi:type IV secretory pathway TrbL component
MPLLGTIIGFIILLVWLGPGFFFMLIGFTILAALLGMKDWTK